MICNDISFLGTSLRAIDFDVLGGVGKVHDLEAFDREIARARLQKFTDARLAAPAGTTRPQLVPNLSLDYLRVANSTYRTIASVTARTTDTEISAGISHDFDCACVCGADGAAGATFDGSFTCGMS